MKDNKIVDDYMFEIEDDYLSDLFSETVKEVKGKSFFDILNLQGSLNRELYLGDIEEGVGTTIEAQIRFWNEYDEKHNIPVEERTPIKIYVDSYGGSLTETLCMIDAIKISKTPVWGICRSSAYSGGLFTLLACHKRFGYAHSSYLFHEGATSNSGTASQFENYSRFYRVQLDQLKEHLLNTTTLNEEWYREHQKEDIWFTAKEALESGIIDNIVETFI